MANTKPQFETTDTKGTTVHYDGAVGTTPATIPSSPDKIISEFWIENDIHNTPVTKRLEFSCDGGVTYTEMNIGESTAWTPKGDIRQIYIKASAAGTLYKMIVNYEEY